MPSRLLEAVSRLPSPACGRAVSKLPSPAGGRGVGGEGRRSCSSLFGWILVLSSPLAAIAQTYPSGREESFPSVYQPPAGAANIPGPAIDQPRPATSLDSRPTSGESAPPAAPLRRDPALPTLSPPSHPAARPENAGPRLDGLRPLATIGASLAVVLGLFFVFAWVLRRATPNAIRPLPGEVVEVLGRAPLTNRQQVQLLRCGRKLLLVCVTPDGAETLTEIADPEEVDYLVGLCRQSQPGSSTQAFRQAMRQFSGEAAEPGRLGRGRLD